MKLPYPYTQAGRYKRGRGTHKPEMIVVHWSAGWGDDDAIADYFVAPKKKKALATDGTTKWVPRDASYHFAVGRMGSVTQLVDTDDTAWHSGGGVDWAGRKDINARSIGVCLANRGPVKASELKRLEAAQVYHGKHTKPGFHGYGATFEAYNFEAMDALRQLVEQLVRLHPTITGVCGHEDLVRGKGDPGPAFNTWNPRWSDMGLVRHVRDWKSGKWRPWETAAG
jgi:N-acetyl-anhydromuramyl-L-alanine amidase AmpD